VEEAEGLESGSAGAEAAGASGVDPVAVALAMGSASREQADNFLEKQSALVDDQRHHLNEQFKHQLNQLRLGIWEKRLGVLLRAATAFVGFAVAVGIGVMVWGAAHSNGLVIEPFAVPPDLAARGLTGQVAASHVLDRLSDLQLQTSTVRPSSTYAIAWDNDIKVEIPETGVSIGELDGFLRRWLGRETHITGDIVRTQTGLAVTARAGQAPARTVTGSEAEMDALVQRAAEAVYAQTQPYRWAVYLQSHGQVDEALADYAALTETGGAEDLPWAYNGWASALYQKGDILAAEAKAYEAQRVVGPNKGIAENLSAIEAPLEHLEAEARYAQAVEDPNDKTTVTVFAQAIVDTLRGDYRASVDIYSRFRQMLLLEGQPAIFDLQLFRMKLEALDHNIAVARGLDRAPTTPRMVEYQLTARFAIAMDLGDWATAAKGLETAQTKLDPSDQRQAISLERTIWPRLALADVKLGRTQEAYRLIAKTPPDCDTCLLTRAEIAVAQHDWSQAAHWFAIVAQRTPSLPQANAQWGQMLLARGDAPGAIAKFTIAHQQGPHFADPLEGWGEALMAENQSHLALAKFEEAQKYAPNWGRLHMKWGEALVYAGKRDEAKAQFARAGQLDLTPTDKAELAQEKT
jgi:tetratricopeptide (TPR) repeat protein